MLYDNKSEAYDLSLFESNAAVALPKELPDKKSQDKKNKSKSSNVVKITDDQIHKIRRRKHNPLKLTVGFSFGIVVTVVIATIIQGNVQLTELNQKIANAQQTLSEQQSVYTQMQMKVESKLSPSIVDGYATGELGMSKATNSQKEFINLSQGDKAEITHVENENIFITIANAITQLWS